MLVERELKEIGIYGEREKERMGWTEKERKRIR